jgi:formylglycine-generating enzyme required for sulfatase activity
MTSTSTPLPVEIIDGKGVAMRLVPGGSFILGSDVGDLGERPAHSVYLDTYYIDKNEVTNALYRACADSGSCPPPKYPGSDTRSDYYENPEYDDYPVINVTWDMADTYCQWRGAQLPTEMQWEKAARGTDGRTYPWGEEIDCDKANYGFCVGDTTRVGSYRGGQSPYGVYDMGGNVEEWVKDWYSAVLYERAANPSYPAIQVDLSSGLYRVSRGGSWKWDKFYVRASNRMGNTRGFSSDRLGFRCALGITP